MALQLFKAHNPDLLARYLNGAVFSKKSLILGRNNRPNPGAAPDDMFLHPVDGLTLIFGTPAATVTFSADLHYRDIVAEINAAAGAEVAHMVKVDANGGMILVLWDDTTPVTLLHTGTANAYFGFSTTASDPRLVQSVIAPADIHTITTDPLSKQWVVFYDA